MLTKIYLARHGFRSSYTVDPSTGIYHAPILSPTKIAVDPPLTSYGVAQSHELATYISTLSPPVQRFYCSPAYRCIQTLHPTLTSLSSSRYPPKLRIYPLLGDWHGLASFTHPSFASVPLLSSLFPSDIDLTYHPARDAAPDVQGESIATLHARMATALRGIIAECDAEGTETILLCFHAAPIIAAGRVLTGRMPEKVDEDDFVPFTCGVWGFVRRGEGKEVEDGDWEGGKGVGGGWDVVENGECEHLSGGQERGWKFSGEESFASRLGPNRPLDVAEGMGVVVEGRKGRPLDTKI